MLKCVFSFAMYKDEDKNDSLDLCKQIYSALKYAYSDESSGNFLLQNFCWKLFDMNYRVVFAKDKYWTGPSIEKKYKDPDNSVVLYENPNDIGKIVNSVYKNIYTYFWPTKTMLVQKFPEIKKEDWMNKEQSFKIFPCGVYGIKDQVIYQLSSDEGFLFIYLNPCKNKQGPISDNNN